MPATRANRDPHRPPSYRAYVFAAPRYDEGMTRLPGLPSHCRVRHAEPGGHGPRAIIALRWMRFVYRACRDYTRRHNQSARCSLCAGPRAPQAAGGQMSIMAVLAIAMIDSDVISESPTRMILMHANRACARCRRAWPRAASTDGRDIVRCRLLPQCENDP